MSYLTKLQLNPGWLRFPPNFFQKLYVFSSYIQACDHFCTWYEIKVEVYLFAFACGCSGVLVTFVKIISLWFLWHHCIKSIDHPWFNVWFQFWVFGLGLFICISIFNRIPNHHVFYSSMKVLKSGYADPATVFFSKLF